MSYGIGLFDSILSVVLSNGFVIFTAILLAVAIAGLIFNKGKKASIKTICLVIIVFCIIYLAAILALVVLFDSSAPPPVPY